MGLPIPFGGNAGSVGSAVAGPAAAPAATQDPAMAAYMRALGFEDAQAQAEATKRISDVNAQAMFQQPEIDYQAGLAHDAVKFDTLGRGVWSSGERLVDEARAQHAQQYATGRLAMNQSQAVGDAQLALARALAQSESQRQTLFARQAAATTAAGGGYDYSTYSGWG